MYASVAFFVALIIALLFVVTSGWLPIVWTKRFQIADPNKRAGVEDSYRKTVAQVLGGAAIALTFAWTWVKDHETIELARIQAANQQFGDAAKLISTQNVDGRAAGIYSMENLVLARPEYYTPVVNTLRSIIKSHRPEPPPRGSEQPKVSDDLMAAIYVLGRLPRADKPIDMQHLYLVGGDFLGLTEFRAADFSGAVLFATNFSGADLTDAIFDGAQMSDWESVGSARWSDQLAQDWVGEKGWERIQFVALFDYATLTNASFKGMSVSGASFQNANLKNTKFNQTDLSRADFRKAVNLDTVDFKDACYGFQGQPLGLDNAILRTLASPCPTR